MKLEAIKYGANAVINVKFHFEKFTEREIRMLGSGKYVIIESIFLS
jgi:uncharacterized protein YbjQ (UPF0145 family)